MKKVINTLLILCIAGLAYVYYGSIMGPIRFQRDKSARDNAVIGRLMDIKAAQTEYNYQHGGEYCNDFDSLIAFIKEGKLPVINKVGNLTDDQLDADWTEGKIIQLYRDAKEAESLSQSLTGYKAAQKAKLAKELWDSAATGGFITFNEDGSKNFIFSRDTIWVSLYDSLYHGKLNVDSLAYIPFSNGDKFELTTESDTSKSGLVQYSFMAKAPFESYLGGLDKQEIINLLEECDDRGRFRGLTIDPNSGNWE